MDHKNFIYPELAQLGLRERMQVEDDHVLNHLHRLRQEKKKQPRARMLSTLLGFFQTLKRKSMMSPS